VAWQDYVDSWPQIQSYKRRVVNLLEDAASVLDIGCGPGGDALALGTRRCAGLDRSMTMCAEANSRGVRAIQADVHHLPFVDRALDGVYADRVIQHVADPLVAVGEMIRIIRPGGRLIVVDPDQESLSIHVPGVRREMLEKLKQLRRDIGYRNGTFVSSLPERLSEMGLVDVSAEPFPLLLTDPADAFGLPSWPRVWRSEGGFTDRDIAEWNERVDVSRHGGFIYSLTYLLVSGVRL
jgi:SAM-dependent methyltransferase